MDWGLAGAIIGSVGGIAGGVIGTYFSVKNTNSPREKAFMIRASVGIWFGVTIFLLMLFLLPTPYKWLPWIPYSVLLPITIITLNKRQAKIRQEENAHNN